MYIQFTATLLALGLVCADVAGAQDSTKTRESTAETRARLARSAAGIVVGPWELRGVEPPSGVEVSADQVAEWKELMELRERALAQLDVLKKEAGVNKASEAEVIYEVGDESLRRRLMAYGVDLEDMVGAGFHTITETNVSGVGVKVVDRRSNYQACARSWKRRPDVGSDAEYPDLSARDALAVRSLPGR